MALKKITLKNGIPVIIDRMTGTNVVTALVLFDVGSRNETAKINGVSHFLEHLFFKGTERRPTTLDISKALDGVGADFNAFTGKEYTGYYVKVDKKHTDLAVDILEDILYHPIFDPKEIDRERGVIIEEINMYEDNPMVLAEEYAEQLVFGEKHPLGFMIAGPVENIKKVTRKQIMDYRETHYRTDNMVIVLAGNVPEHAEKLLKTLFNKKEKSVGKKLAEKKFSFTQKESRFKLYTKDTAQAHIALSFPGPKHGDKNAAAYSVLSTILGSSMSSRLFINVRERQGLCYYIGSSVSPYDDMGVFTIQAGFDKTRIHDALAAIIHELSLVVKHGVTDEEVAQAKEYFRGKMSIRLEDSEDVASWWGKQALFQKEMKSPAEQIAVLDAVTVKQVNALAKKVFRAAQANLSVVGPYKKTQEKQFKKHLHFDFEK